MTRRTLNFFHAPARSAVALLAFTFQLPYATPLGAQQPARGDTDSIKVFHLTNVAQAGEANDIVSALRNVLGSGHVSVHAETNDILVAAPPDQLALAGRLIAQLDRPKRAYRLTFTLNEADSGKRIGVQHFSLVAVTGQHTVLEQGDKVSVVTGSFNTDQKAQQTQFTYLDVGMNFDVTLDEFANGLRLRSRVEQSSVADSQSGKLPDDPIVRQSLLEGTALLALGKPLILGSLDIVGSTRHVDIEVVAEPLS